VIDSIIFSYLALIFSSTIIGRHYIWKFILAPESQVYPIGLGWRSNQPEKGWQDGAEQAVVCR
jgi:hypothetical protein